MLRQIEPTQPQQAKEIIASVTGQLLTNEYDAAIAKGRQPHEVDGLTENQVKLLTKDLTLTADAVKKYDSLEEDRARQAAFELIFSSWLR